MFEFFSRKKHFSSFRIIVYGFLFVILTGSFLLMLPIATQDGQGASFLDALFTSTSAVCVTGLVVKDTATYWTQFGQLVIITLIQIGGMGVVTVAIAIAVISGKKIGLMQRSTMQEAIAVPQVGGIVRLTKFILITTFTVEALGALIMAPVFCSQFGFLKGIWYGIFHSISAFCNAGFDLMGVTGPFSSLTSFTGQPIINLVIMFLIVFGGISFLTWDDIVTHKWHLSKYRMQSKVILTTTGLLILLPTLYFFFVEFARPVWADMTFSERLLASLFQTITPRTAGFNTVDLTLISEAGILIMVILMLIGGSPGSTAGGMKTTTVAVLFASAFAVFHKREDAHYFGRRIPSDAIRNAAVVLMMYLVLFLTSTLIISTIEELPILTTMYETASAIGTVGLTLGITPELGNISHIILISLMFFGRVGGLTLIFAALPDKHKCNSKLPQEKIAVA